MTTTTISFGSPGWLSDNSWSWKYITRGLHRTLQSLSAIHNIYRESYNLVKLSISAGVTHTSSSSSSYEWESPTSLIETVTIAMWGVRWLVSDGGPQYWHQSDLCCENSASWLDWREREREREGEGPDWECKFSLDWRARNDTTWFIAINSTLVCTSDSSLPLHPPSTARVLLYWWQFHN